MGLPLPQTVPVQATFLEPGTYNGTTSDSSSAITPLVCGGAPGSVDGPEGILYVHPGKVLSEQAHRAARCTLKDECCAAPQL